MASTFRPMARRREHLQAENLLRSLTEVINKVPNGINLGQGVCDLDTPGPLCEGATQSIAGADDRQTYTFYAGLPEARHAVARKLREFNGLSCGAEEVMITTGSSGAFFAAGMTLIEPGDEVILFEPFYSYHYSCLKLFGAVPVCVPLGTEDYALDVQRLQDAITDKTRALVLNTPGNPSGKVFSAADLEAIAQVLQGTRVLVFTDEVYEYMCFDGRKHLSPAAMPGFADRTLTMGSFSKTYSITGWRIGYLAGNKDVVDAVGRVFDQMNVCAPRPLQRGVTKALQDLPPAFYADLQTDYERKRDLFCAALEKGGYRFSKPEGAYYVMADYRDVFGDVDPHQAVLRLIEQKGINAVPGHVFYANPDGIRSMRFQFAVADTVLADACERLGG